MQRFTRLCIFADQRTDKVPRLPHLIRQRACERNLPDHVQAARFAALFDKYQDFSELTPGMIHQLAEKIVVHERDIKDSQNSPQQIDICFRESRHPPRPCPDQQHSGVPFLPESEDR